MIAGIVLAAGSSTRLGRNKLLVELEGETLVRRAARRAIEAGLSPVIVVLGFEADAVAAELREQPVEIALNPGYAAGMHTSLTTGLTALPAPCPAATVLLADMPLVTVPMLAATASRFRATGAPLVVSLYGGQQAPPTLYARALFPDLLAAGPAGGSRVVQDHWERAERLHWPPERLADLDRPEDLERLGPAR